MILDCTVLAIEIWWKADSQEMIDMAHTGDNSIKVSLLFDKKDCSIMI